MLHQSRISKIADPLWLDFMNGLGLSTKIIHRFDYVVVGAGTAGCLLANRLSRNPNNTVALIEAGGSNRFNPMVHVPVGYLLCVGNPLTDWCFKTAA